MKYKVGDRFQFGSWHVIVEIQNKYNYHIKRERDDVLVIGIHEEVLDSARKKDLKARYEYMDKIEKHYAI